jgi:hypothetical protein
MYDTGVTLRAEFRTVEYHKCKPTRLLVWRIQRTALHELSGIPRGPKPGCSWRRGRAC